MWRAPNARKVAENAQKGFTNAPKGLFEVPQVAAIRPRSETLRQGLGEELWRSTSRKRVSADRLQASLRQNPNKMDLKCNS